LDATADSTILLNSRSCTALPTIYHVGDDGEAEAIMVAISSTAIPIEDLPTYEVGVGFGLTKEKDKVKKPHNLKDLQLITAKNQHRFVAAAGVQELTKEEFDQFHLSEKK
jgi:hypothetical protein